MTLPATDAWGGGPFGRGHAGRWPRRPRTCGEVIPPAAGVRGDGPAVCGHEGGVVPLAADYARGEVISLAADVQGGGPAVPGRAGYGLAVDTRGDGPFGHGRAGRWSRRPWTCGGPVGRGHSGRWPWTDVQRGDLAVCGRAGDVVPVVADARNTKKPTMS